MLSRMSAGDAERGSEMPREMFVTVETHRAVFVIVRRAVASQRASGVFTACATACR